MKKLIPILLTVAIVGCGNDSPSEKQVSSKAEVVVSEGETIVTTRCVVCHANGINGAPIIGNSKMWSKRLTRGKEQLISNAINGYELMPAKGGQTDLSDEQIGMAVEYMISQVK